jgi:hypothetical protein
MDYRMDIAAIGRCRIMTIPVRGAAERTAEGAFVTFSRKEPERSRVQVVIAVWARNENSIPSRLAGTIARKIAGTNGPAGILD